MIKNRLREIRLNLAAKEGRFITQTEMASILGVNVVVYNRWENNNTQPSLEAGYLIAQKLNMFMEEIFYIPSE